MSAAVSLQCAVSLAEAKRLVDDRTVDPLLRVAANSIISLHGAVGHLDTAVRESDALIAEQARVIRILTDDAERLRRELDEANGVIR